MPPFVDVEVLRKTRNDLEMLQGKYSHYDLSKSSAFREPEFNFLIPFGEVLSDRDRLRSTRTFAGHEAIRSAHGEVCNVLPVDFK